MNNSWILKSDKMSPKERIDRMLACKAVDHVGFFLMARGFCARITNIPLESIYKDPARSLEAQIWTQQMYGHDQKLRFGAGCFGALEFGGEIKMPTDERGQAPFVIRHPVQSEEDLRELRLPDVKTAGMIPLCMEFSKLQEEAGLTRTIQIGTPFTIAGEVCGIERLLRWMLKKPGFVHRILRLVTDFCVNLSQYWVDTFGCENVELREGAPTESNQVISPDQFREFVFPYLKELHEKVLRMGVKYIYTHICGDQNLNLSYWTEIPFGNPGIVSIGHEVELTSAIKYFGEKCIIVGNINPAMIQIGTPLQIYELSKLCIEKGKYSPRGFILAPGCELPPLSPACNVWAMKKAINDFGWYEG